MISSTMQDRSNELNKSEGFELGNTRFRDEKIALQGMYARCQNCGLGLDYDLNVGGSMAHPGGLMERAAAREVRLNPDSGAAFVVESGGGSIGATAPPARSVDEDKEFNKRRDSRIEELRKSRQQHDPNPL